MTQDDVLLNKAETIKRCLQRIHDECESTKDFENDISVQDAVTLNLLRACEATIDMGAHFIKLKKLGLPQYTRDVFVFLEEAKIISSELSKHMQSMVGFRNLAIHDYQKISLSVLDYILKNRLSDFKEFIHAMFSIT